MCNFIKQLDYLEHKKIPKSGRGYKWMRKSCHDFYQAPFKGEYFKIGVMYTWNDKVYQLDGDGFTLFRSKREAMKARPNIKCALSPYDCKDLVLLKVKYDKGLVSRMEPDPAVQARISLCKELTFIGEVKKPIRKKETK